jgi:hypothetical protein
MSQFALEGASDECLQEAGAYGIGFYVKGHCKRKRIGPDNRLAEAVWHKRMAE